MFQIPNIQKACAGWQNCTKKKQVSSLAVQTLNKAVEYEVSQSKSQLAEIEKILTDYEKQFNLTTVEFFKRYQAGQTDDSAESMEWASLAQMAENIRKRLALFSEISE
jgi:hypothetical protein